MADLIKFKRGQSATWKAKNILLDAGEPGYEMDTNKFKVGDGKTPWNDLPYVGDHNIVNYKTHYDFPSVGNENYLYKASSEELLYQWDAEKMAYVSLGAGTSISDAIDFIDGGNADGNS